MEHAQDPGLEVGERAVDGLQAPVEAQRDRVDGHVAAGVGLRAGAHQVVPARAVAHERGAEAVVLGRLAAQPRHGRGDVAGPDQVELAGRAPEQQIAHGAPDEI